MSVNLKSEISDLSVHIYDPSVNIDELPEDEGFSYKFPDVGNAIDDMGMIRYLSIDLWEGTPDYLDHIISYFESYPVAGTYTVEDLGLYDVPFVEVLRAIKNRYAQMLMSQSQK